MQYNVHCLLIEITAHFPMNPHCCASLRLLWCGGGPRTRKGQGQQRVSLQGQTVLGLCPAETCSLAQKTTLTADRQSEARSTASYSTEPMGLVTDMCKCSVIRAHIHTDLQKKKTDERDAVSYDIWKRLKTSC